MAVADNINIYNLIESYQEEVNKMKKETIKYLIIGVVILTALFYFGVFDNFLKKQALNSVNRLGTMAVADIEGDFCDENTDCGGCWAEGGIGYIYCDNNACNINFCVDVVSEKEWVEGKLPEYKKYILLGGIVFIFGLVIYGSLGRKFKFA